MLWNMGTNYAVVVKIRPENVRPHDSCLGSGDAFDKDRYTLLETTL